MDNTLPIVMLLVFTIMFSVKHYNDSQIEIAKLEKCSENPLIGEDNE